MISKYILSAACAALVGFSAVGVQAGDAFTIDPAHTSIGFQVRHMVITNVKGTFNDVEGNINYNADDITKSSVEVTIKTASVDTRNQKRDDHLKSPDFFAVEEFPTLTFKSKKVMKKGDGYVAVGDLTIRGVTKEIELPFTLNGPVQNPWGQTVIGIEAEYEINRHDFGVSWSKTMDNGGLVVSDNVKIELQVEATKS